MIELRQVTMKTGAFEICDVNLAVADGRYAVLMGRTGCGKTSLLEAICGLRRIVAGQILIDDVNVADWSPADRGVGYVPQDLALFPTFTVREHLQFAPRLRKWGRREIEQRTQEMAGVLGITHLLDRRVHGLSGGEAQRTALGRALSFRPSVLLLDEPLSALDDNTRHEMYELLGTVRKATGVTTLHVTHSQEEAQALADVRAEIVEGKVHYSLVV